MEGSPGERWKYRRGGEAPQPGDAGPKDRLLRFRILQDGIDACIRSLPLSEKTLARKLQEAWLICDETVHQLVKEQPPEWQLPLPD